MLARRRPFHDDEGRAGDPRRVVVRVLLQAANHLQREKLRANVVEQNLAVRGLRSIQRAGIDCLRSFLELMQRRDLARYLGGRVVLQLRVVLVQARRRAAGGGELEIYLGEELVGEGGKGLLRLRRRRGVARAGWG